MSSNHVTVAPLPELYDYSFTLKVKLTSLTDLEFIQILWHFWQTVMVVQLRSLALIVDSSIFFSFLLTHTSNVKMCMEAAVYLYYLKLGFKLVAVGLQLFILLK